VDAPELGVRRVREAAAVLRARHVGRDGERPPPEGAHLARDRLERRRRARREDDVRPLARQGERDRAPEPRADAGHDRDAVLEEGAHARAAARMRVVEWRGSRSKRGITSCPKSSIVCRATSCGWREASSPKISWSQPTSAYIWTPPATSSGSPTSRLPARIRVPDGVLVGADERLEVARRAEREAERTDAETGRLREGGRAAARHPERRVRARPRLGKHVARRHGEEPALVAVRRLAPHAE